MPLMKVWAPFPKKVQLITAGQTLDMIPRERGWWQLDVPILKHGCDYGFLLDGKGPFPDPRSPWQPRGVHGLSRHLDHTVFSWTDRGWQPQSLGGAVIYELHIGTFTSRGTFQAATEHLGHLLDLGVTHVELMPVAEFPGNRGWGYDGVDLYAPHHAYGGPNGLKELVDRCHRCGLAVILDVVYNHLGPSGNYLPLYGPYFTDRYRTPWGDAVNFDGPGSDEVRQFVIDNAIMWFRDYHMDGLRLDAVHAILDRSAFHVLEMLAAHVRKLEVELGRPMTIIAENDQNDPRPTWPRERGGYGLDAQMNEDFHHALHTVLTGEKEGYYRDFGHMADLAKVLRDGWAYDGRYSSWRDKTHGRTAERVPRTAFIGCLQNHDQVGNRALGDRTSHLLSKELLKVGAALVLAGPFVPMLFQGEEWGARTPFTYFTDHSDPDLAEAVSQGRQSEFAAFGWEADAIPDPQSEETFLQSQLQWDELALPPHDEILDWHRNLIRLRRTFYEGTGRELKPIRVDFNETSRWLTLSSGSWTLVCNMSDRVLVLPAFQAGRYCLRLASRSGGAVTEQGLILPGPGAAFLEEGQFPPLSAQETTN